MVLGSPRPPLRLPPWAELYAKIVWIGLLRSAANAAKRLNIPLVAVVDVVVVVVIVVAVVGSIRIRLLRSSANAAFCSGFLR